MKKSSYFFSFFIIFFLWGLLTTLFAQPAHAYASCFTISVTAVNVPSLPSPGDNLTVNVATRNDCAFVVGNGYTLGVAFDVGDNTSFFNPSFSYITFPRSLYPAESISQNFSTSVQSGNICTTTGSKVRATGWVDNPNDPDPRQSTSQWVSQSLGGIGATMKVHVLKPDGTDVPDGTRVDIAGTYTTTKYTSGGYVTFNILDCGVSHTITAYWNNQSVSKSGISVYGGVGYFICNGQERTIDLQFSTPTPTLPPGGTPTPTPTLAPGTCSLSPTCSGQTPGLSATWNYGGGANCNPFVQAGPDPYNLGTTNCSGSWSGTQLPNGPTIVNGGIYSFYLGQGGNNNPCGTVTPNCAAVTPTPTPTPGIAECLYGSCGAQCPPQWRYVSGANCPAWYDGPRCYPDNNCPTTGVSACYECSFNSGDRGTYYGHLPAEGWLSQGGTRDDCYGKLSQFRDAYASPPGKNLSALISRCRGDYDCMTTVIKSGTGDTYAESPYQDPSYALCRRPEVWGLIKLNPNPDCSGGTDFSDNDEALRQAVEQNLKLCKTGTNCGAINDPNRLDEGCAVDIIHTYNFGMGRWEVLFSSYSCYFKRDFIPRPVPPPGTSFSYTAEVKLEPVAFNGRTYRAVCPSGGHTNLPLVTNLRNDSTPPAWGLGPGVVIRDIGISTAVSYSISGYVFKDSDKDGVKDTNEQCFDASPNGNLSLSRNGVVQQKFTTSSTNTCGSPSYTFSNLANGTYTVAINQPSGWSVTTPLSQTVSVPPSRTNINFGLIDTTLSGRVYDDPSGNCTGTTGVDAAAVTVNCPPTTPPTNTGPDGHYDLNNLNLGLCTINAAKPNYRLSPCVVQNINLTAGANTKDLYLKPPGPWFAGKGADMRKEDGFTDPVPLGNYALLDGVDIGGTPGVIFSGDRSYDFSPGSSSSTRWVAGPPYPEVFTPVRSGLMRTSYAYYDNLIRQSGITPTDLVNTCTNRNPLNCTLPANLANGIYKANESVTLGNNYTFPRNKNFVILINGNLTLKGNITVPVGSTVVFSVAGDIIVDKNVGQAQASSTNPNLEGFFSADKSFIVQGNNNCGVGRGGADKRLNIAGAVFVNVKQNRGVLGGSLQNNRDLCAGNLNPSLFISERPDLILNAPAFLKHPNFIWQEVAP